MAQTTFSVDGKTMLQVVMEVIVCFENGIHGTSDLASCSECHQIWMPTRLFSLKAPGRCDFIRVNHWALMTTKELTSSYPNYK